MVEYEKAIKRPFQDVKKLLIGAILNIIPIVNLIASGYIIKAAKGTMKKKNDMPEWEDWGNLFMTGLVVAVIGFIYMIPAVGLLVVGVGSAVIGAIAVGGAAAMDMTAVLAGGGITILAGLLLLLVTMLVMPMAIIRYVDKGSFSAAFGFTDILKKVLTGKYIVAWLLVLVYSVVVFGITMWIPIVGPAIGSFIAGVTSMTVFAEVYSEL